MTKRLNDASADEWTRASSNWNTNLCAPSDTMVFDDYVAREKANFFAAIDEYDWDDHDAQSYFFNDDEDADLLAGIDWIDDIDWVDNVRPDNVNNPDHYNQGGIECIDYIKQQLGDSFESYCQGNVTKYLHRWRYKNGLEDLKKAQWYLNQMVKAVEEIGD